MLAFFLSMSEKHMNAEQLEPNKVEPILQRAKSSDLDTMVAVARKTIDRCYRYFLDN